MPVLALLVVVLAIAAGSCGILTLARRIRTPRELRGDWWSEFEREFRAYATRAANPSRERRRHRGERA